MFYARGEEGEKGRRETAGSDVVGRDGCRNAVQCSAVFTLEEETTLR